MLYILAIISILIFVLALIRIDHPLAGLANIFRLSERFHLFFSQLSQTKPDNLETIKFYVGWQPAFLVRNPMLVKSIFNNQDSFNRINSIFTRSMSTVIGTNIITADTALWKQLRPLYEKYFSKYIKNFFYTTDEVINKVIDSQPKELVVEEFAYRIAGLAATASFLGIPFEEIDSSVVFDCVTVFNLIRDNTISMLPMIPLWIPTTRNKQVLEARSRVYKFLEKHIQTQRGTDSVFGDIIARNEGNNQLVVEEAISFIIGGLETTAIVLSWICYYLAINPEIQTKARNEILSVGPLGYNNKGELKYIGNIIWEVLRLHSPATTSCLVATQETVLDYNEPIIIPKGSLVFMSQYVNHRLSTLWTDPELFNPDRYEKENKSNLHPFGGGGFVCVGKEFSIQEAKLLISALLRRYRFTLVSGSSEMDIKVTARPKDKIKIKLLDL